jgi:hypothetical protein
VDAQAGTATRQHVDRLPGAGAPSLQLAMALAVAASSTVSAWCESTRASHAPATLDGATSS